MIPLLKIYDDFTSNKSVSLGASVISTAFMTYRAISLMSYTNPVIFVVSACAGISFSFLANTYLVHNDSVKKEGEKNSIYATLSLLTSFTPIRNSRIYRAFFERTLDNFFDKHSYRFCSYGFLNGLGVGFLATNLVFQIKDGQTKIKLRSPFVFE